MSDKGSIYGEPKIARRNKGSSGAQAIDIFQIYPDPAQPRRVVPPRIRSAWDGTGATVEHLFGAWNSFIADSRGRDVEANWKIIKDIVKGTETPRYADEEYKSNPAEIALFRVADLAASIRSNGLINPITISKSDTNWYVIETGERRWLAYHLLYFLYGEEYRSIPSVEVPQRDVWKQAFENAARDDLNAIGKARQFAILLMALYPDAQFKPFHECRVDREYYAQVANGDEFRVPRNSGEKLMQATGLPNRSALARYRQLLLLPDIVWEAADELDWTEHRLRWIMAPNEKETINRAISEAKKDGYDLEIGCYTLPVDNISGEKQAKSGQVLPSEQIKDSLARISSEVQKWQKIASKTRRLPEAERLKLLQELEHYESQVKQGFEDLRRKLGEQ